MRCEPHRGRGPKAAGPTSKAATSNANPTTETPISTTKPHPPAPPEPARPAPSVRSMRPAKTRTTTTESSARDPSSNRPAHRDPRRVTATAIAGSLTATRHRLPGDAEASGAGRSPRSGHCGADVRSSWISATIHLRCSSLFRLGRGGVDGRGDGPGRLGLPPSSRTPSRRRRAGASQPTVWRSRIGASARRRRSRAGPQRLGKPPPDTRRPRDGDGKPGRTLRAVPHSGTSRDRSHRRGRRFGRVREFNPHRPLGRLARGCPATWDDVKKWLLTCSFTSRNDVINLTRSRCAVSRLCRGVRQSGRYRWMWHGSRPGGGQHFPAQPRPASRRATGDGAEASPLDGAGRPRRYAYLRPRVDV